MQMDNITTNTAKTMTILLVDDDRGILFTLQKLIEKIFPDLEIIKATDGKMGLEMMEKHQPSIILSDYNMPIMNGIQFLTRVRADKSNDNIYFIMITANTETENRRNAMQIGADEFLSKPIITEVLEARLRSAFRIISMQKQLKDENTQLHNLTQELEDTIQDMAKLSVKFMHARIPTSYQTLQRVANASTWIAEQFQFSKNEIRDIELAAYLSQAGRFSLPDSLINKPVLVDGNPSSELMYSLPAATRDIVATIRTFDNIGNILFSLYENIDGSGFPSHLRAWQIPFASRIIRVCLDYEELCLYQKHTPFEALEVVKKQSQKAYDHRVVVLFENYLKSHNKNFITNDYPVRLADLKSGMILSRDIITDKGHKLLSAGALLNSSIIQKIIAHASSDPILGNIYIKK